MRLYTVLDTIINRIKIATQNELTSGTESTPRVIAPSTFKGAIDSILNSIGLGDISSLNNNQFVVGAMRMAWGKVSLSTVAANSYVDVSVTFPTPFAEAPHVMVCQVSTSAASAYAAIEVVVKSVTASGATFRFYNNSGTSRVPIANWTAMGAA